MSKSIGAFVLILILFVMTAFGQSGKGTITGRITDNTGAGIPGVEIKAVNIATEVPTTSISNSDGRYTLLNLPIGTYRVTTQKQGFKGYTREGLTISINQVVDVPVELEVGGINEMVTISENAGILNTETSEIGSHMKNRVVTDLPLNISGGRNIEGFAYAITPSVEGNGWQSYIAGSAAFTKEVVIDGTSAVLQIGGNLLESSPTMESVEEFKVETSGMSAEYGRTGGGLFNFSMKSGTNKYHGSAYGFLRNEVLNANSWGNKFLGDERSRDRQHIYGFSGGGPISIPRIYNGENRTFIFGTYERYNQNRQLLGGFDQTVPIPAFLNGDFSALIDKTKQLGVDAGGNPIYKGAILDPKTGLVFTNNIIPQNRLSVKSKQIADIYRKSYQPMVAGALTNNSAKPYYVDPLFTQDQFTFKVDHHITTNASLSGSLITTDRPRTLVDAGGIWDPTDTTGGPLSRARKHDVTTRQARISYNQTFSPTLLNVVNVNYGMFRNPSTALASSDNWPDKLGFTGDLAGNFPEVDFGGAVNGIWTSKIGYSSSDYYVAHNYVINDNLSWVKGKHSFKFGGDLRLMQFNSHSAAPTLGFNFNNNSTGVPRQDWSSQVGYGFASFMLGEVDSAYKNVRKDLYGRRKYYALFVQDDFKATQKLTLNLGLRWEQTAPLKEKYGRWSNYNTEKINPVTGKPGVLEFAGDSNTSFEGPRDWKEFGPRIGAAYRLTSRMTLRGSYGIFYSPIGLNTWAGVPYAFAPGFTGTDRVIGQKDLKPAFNWDQGYPGVYEPAKQDPNFTTWGMVSNNPNGLKAGRIQQWNIGTEFELTNNLKLSINYLGNKGRRLQSGDLQRNQPDPKALANLIASGKEWSWVSDEASAKAANVPYPYTGFANSAFFALFPNVKAAETWGPIFFVNSPLGSNSYKALQVSVSKRLSKGLAADVSYTLSKATGNVESGFQERWWVGPLQDVTKLEEESKIVQAYDQTHVFKGYVSWELPFGKGRPFFGNSGEVINTLIGGWTVSSVFRYNSGNPLAISSNNWMPGWGFPIYADMNASGNFNRVFDSSNYVGGKLINSPGNLYFDPTSFSNPKNGELGNSPRRVSQLRGFGRAYEDLGIMKNIIFRERFRFQIRGELINVFNRHYFNDPETNVGSPNFGYVTGVSGEPRLGQVGLRFEW